MLKKLTTTGSGLAMLALVVLAVNIIASRLSTRVDVTSEKVFSLSEGTEKILEKLDSEVTAKLYFSRSLKELPVVVKTYATRVEEVLTEYAARSGGKLKLETLDPKPDTDDEEWAQRYGINAARLPSGESMFFGIVFQQGAKEVVIPYLDPRREELLEYDLSEALVSVFRKETAKIAIASSLPVMGGGGAQAMGGGEGPWVFVTDLKRNFDVQELLPSTREIAPEIQVVVLIHPKNLDETTLYAVDQFVLRGGRLIAIVDPLSRVDLMMASAMQRGQMPDASSDLAKLFGAWGLEYDKAKLVGDATMATRINAGGAELSYPFFMSVGETAFNAQSVIAGKLRQMLLGEPGSIALKAGTTGVTLEPLITTTKESGTAQAMLAGIMGPQDVMREMKLDGQERVLAGLLKGKLKGAFAAAPADAPPPEGGSGAPPPRQLPHLAESAGESTVLVIADTDFLFDGNAVEKFPFGNQMMVRMRNDNLSFLSNAVDFLGGSQDLISIRSRGRIARPFTRVAALQASAQKRWQAEEERLTKELTDLQGKLNDLQKQRTDGNRFVLTAEQQKKIDDFREQERAVKKARRDVRRNLREDIERLGNRLVALNMLVVPFACTVFGAVVFARRGRRRKEVSRG